MSMNFDITNNLNFIKIHNLKSLLDDIQKFLHFCDNILRSYMKKNQNKHTLQLIKVHY